MVDYPLLAVIVTALLAQRCSQTDQLQPQSDSACDMLRRYTSSFRSQSRPPQHLSF